MMEELLQPDGVTKARRITSCCGCQRRTMISKGRRRRRKREEGSTTTPNDQAQESAGTSYSRKNTQNLPPLICTVVVAVSDDVL